MQKNFYPQAFGPGTWRDLPEVLIRLYSTIQKTDEKPIELEQEETPPPSDTLEIMEA